MGQKSIRSIYDTDDTLRNTLTVEVSEQVDMMKVWERKAVTS